MHITFCYEFVKESDIFVLNDNVIRLRRMKKFISLHSSAIYTSRFYKWFNINDHTSDYLEKI